MVDNIFIQISTLLAITVTIALVLRLFKQPLVVAYIIAGIIGGPLFFNLLHGGEEFFQTFAHFGIVLLLFIVGLSLNFDYIRKVGKVVFIGGMVQFLVTASLGFLIMTGLGFSLVSALFIGIAITFSSTIIVVKFLTDKKDTESMYGRYVIGLLLVQDIIAVTIMIFLNTSQLDGTISEMLMITISKGIVLVGIVFLAAKYVLPVIMEKVAHSGELLFIFTITWCFGIASLIYWAGFNIEIGAVIAGISLGASPYQAQIASRIRPLRDFFIVLFFIVLGSQMQVGDIYSSFWPAIILSVFVLIIDPFVLYSVMRKMRYTRRNAFLAGITSAQVSEFGFILVFKGADLGYLQGNEVTILTMTALITIIISSYFITYNEQFYGKVLPLFKKFGKDKLKDKITDAEPYKVWVFGYHRIGWKVCEALEDMKVKFAVVDFSPESIAKLKSRSIPAYFGDAADVEFLQTLPLEKATLIISTIPEVDDQNTMIRTVRQEGGKAMIIANLYHPIHLDDVYKAGADYVMMPHLLGGSWMSNILKEKPWTKRTFSELKKEQVQEMRQRFDENVHDV
ncbi:MAG: cation:proton antiporter [bacterium]|nr:cation:proton antiporter [bacterium]